MAKKKKLARDKSLTSWLIPHLRALSRTWPQRDVAKARFRVKVETGEFYKNGNPITESRIKCNNCGYLCHPGYKDKNNPANNIEKEYAMDHIVSVVGIDGFTNWDDYITGLFCGPDNYQALCSPCHYIKTQAENEQRKLLKKQKKKESAKNNKKDEDLY